MQVNRIGRRVFPLCFIIMALFTWHLEYIQDFLAHEWRRQAETLQDKHQICAMFSQKYEWFNCKSSNKSNTLYSKCNYIKQKQKEFICKL